MENGMSLCKKFQIWLIVLLLALLGGVLKIKFDSTRSLATDQLSYTTRNIADLLALEIGQQLNNRAQLESKINWIFDSGNFEIVALFRSDGSMVYQREAPKKSGNSPSFLKSFTTIDPPVVDAQVFIPKGKFGTLRIKLQAAPFYAELWTTLKRIALLFFFAGIFMIISIHSMSKLFLRTLNQIEMQAKAVCANEYIINEEIPGTPELKQTALAMNTMVEKVQGIHKRRLDDIKYFQELQFIDTVTGLYNRKYIIKRLSHFLDSDTEKAYGHFLLVGIMGMEKNNIPIGHPDIKTFYKNLADTLKHTVGTVENAVTARLAQQEFGAILPDCNSQKALAIARAAVDELLALMEDRPEFSGRIEIYGGLAGYTYKDDTSSVLSKTDYALSAAKNSPSGALEIFQTENNQTIMGKYQWQIMLHSALADQRFILLSQPVVSDQGELHQEVYINFADSNGRVYKAGYFMPMAISLGLAGRIDKYVLERVAQHLKKIPARALAVNITDAFCKDRLAGIWLRQFLEANQFLREQLFFEIHDNTLIQYPDLCFDLTVMLQKLGFGIGIDQLSLNDTSLNLLNDLKPVYVKIEKDYFHDMNSGLGNTEVALNSLRSLTDSLDIKLIVTKIEDTKMYQALLSKRIKYFQGLAIAPITPLDSAS